MNDAQGMYRLAGLHIPQTPLLLKAKSSFCFGGQAVEQSFVELGSQRAADRVTVG